MNKLLNTINSPEDLKNLSIPQLSSLADELREYIISVVSTNGGHLAPSLGVVELTIALHYVFDAPKDKIIWDVGHQSYPHKILTGRREQFHTIRQYEGISGFPRMCESEYDAFGTGHSSTSISASLGMACARDIKGDNFKTVAIIGDGSMTGGMAFEGLNHAGHLQKSNFIVILNDNKMSISKNVGALSQYLNRIILDPFYNKIRKDIWDLTGRLSEDLKGKVRVTARKLEESIKNLIAPGLLFEELGFRYFGPVNGHNCSQLIKVLLQAKEIPGPILIHVYTIKGKGYHYAEKDAPRFHGLGSFDKTTGKSIGDSDKRLTYTEVFGKTMVTLGERFKNLVAITAAMPDGTGLTPFSKAYPDRFFDVGIAEQHAVTFGAGLATEGIKPVVAIYSTFMQRAFDQVIHDVALQNLPVVLALDRGGIVGEDGATHNGAFDLSYLRMMPNIIVSAPKDEQELQNLLYTAVKYNKGPFAIRYPRAKGIGLPLLNEFDELEIGKAEILREGSDVAILAVGSMVYPALESAEILSNYNVFCTVVNVRFVKPLDEELILQLAKDIGIIVTVEENTLVGGFGSAVMELLERNGIYDVLIKRIGIPDNFIEHGARSIILKKIGLTKENIMDAVLKITGRNLLSKTIEKWGVVNIVR